MIKSTRRQLFAAMALTGLAWSVTGFAQWFPDKPITIVVAYPPGSDTDVMAGLYAKKLASRLRQPVAIAVADPGRSPFLPDVPTIAESGYPEVRLRAWNAFFAPAGTPAPVVRLLNEQLAEVLRLPDVIEKLARLSAVPAGGLPERLGTQVASDYDQLGQRLRELRLQAD